MHAFDRRTDGQTVGQTDRKKSLDRVCIPCSAVKIALVLELRCCWIIRVRQVATLDYLPTAGDLSASVNTRTQACALGQRKQQQKQRNNNKHRSSYEYLTTMTLAIQLPFRFRAPYFMRLTAIQQTEWPDLSDFFIPQRGSNIQRKLIKYTVFVIYVDCNLRENCIQ